MTLRKLIFTTLLLLLAPQMWGGEFEQYFTDSTLRVDYVLSGNAQAQYISFDGASRLPGWYGKRSRLTEIPVHGFATITMTRAADNKLIYRNTFSTLFQEWLDLDDARHWSKAFECVRLLPMPCDSVAITLTLYDHRHNVQATFTHGVSPRDCTLRRLGESHVPRYVEINTPSDPNNAINIAFIAEGYTAEQMEDYLDDCRRGTEGLFEYEPFKSNRDKFHIIAVCTPSRHSGPSIPSDGVWNTTAIGSSFDTFGSARYLTTLRLKQMHDALAGTPYEHIIAMVNTPHYGGGGIYNTFNLLMTKHRLFVEVLVHEFGHSFVGLADEYAYEGEEPLNFPLDVEPWAPNITTLADFGTKWQPLLGDAKVTITDDDNLDTETLGLYEGAGCVTKGVYRPCPNCLMRTLKVPQFCPVCRQAIQEIIDFYTK